MHYKKIYEEVLSDVGKPPRLRKACGHWVVQQGGYYQVSKLKIRAHAPVFE